MEKHKVRPAIPVSFQQVADGDAVRSEASRILSAQNSSDPSAASLLGRCCGRDSSGPCAWIGLAADPSFLTFRCRLLDCPCPGPARGRLARLAFRTAIGARSLRRMDLNSAAPGGMIQGVQPFAPANAHQQPRPLFARRVQGRVRFQPQQRKLGTVGRRR